MCNPFRPASLLLALTASGICALSLAAFCGKAQAQSSLTLLSNLGATVSTSGGTPINNTVQKAFAFTTGNTDYALSSVQMYLARAASGGSGQSLLSLGLYTPSTLAGNLPGTLVAELGTATVTNLRTTRPPVTTFTPSSGFNLASRTRYVLLLGYESGDDAYWSAENGLASAPPIAMNGSGYSLPAYTLIDNGTTTTSTSGFNSIAINGTVPNSMGSPEPGSLSLFGIGIAGGAGTLGAIRRRRKARTA